MATSWMALPSALALPDGTFSRSDEAAVRFAREQCPHRASVLGSAAIAAPAVICDRSWAIPAATVARMVTARCAAPDESARSSSHRRRCGDTHVLLHWSDLPLTFC